MADYLKRSWAVVNLDRVSHNFLEIKKRLSPRCMVMGVIKADAYGHGDKYIADELVRLGADWFGVSNIDEAVSLRKKGIFAPILIFGDTPHELAGVLNEYNITQAVFSADYARRLQDAARTAGVRLNVHIKVDTGMSRLGFDYKADGEIIAAASCENLVCQGIFTHFACADETEDDSVSYTRTQFKRFSLLIERLEANGLRFAVKHCCNSAAVIMYPEMHMDMVRPGIALYGLNPSTETAGKLELRPVMELYSVVAMVKEIEKGTAVSYGRKFTADQRIKVATVPIGYADGFGRELSGRARMLVRGQFAPVIGRVCMDQLILDVTGITASAGDIVTVIGGDGGKILSFDEMAGFSGTINYEKVCLVGKRVPRVYRRGGKDVGAVDYNR